MPHTQASSLVDVFLAQVDARADAVALRFVVNDEEVSWSWQQLGQAVFRMVDALHELGMGRGEHVVHWSPNRQEWIVMDLALQGLGSVHVPLHSSLSPRQAVDQIVHSEARFAVVADDHVLRTLQPFAHELPTRLSVSTYEPSDRAAVPGAHRLSQLVESACPLRGRQRIEETLKQSDRHACTTILYTSGTMGQPKGIMLSQHNLFTNALSVVETFGEQPLELRLNFLPLSHIFARTCDVYTWLVRGSELALSQSRDTIIDDCKRFRPTLINGVPFFFERVRQKLVEKQVAAQPGILQRTLGGEIRGCFSGGGALAEHTYRYYQEQGVPLMQGYGLTETSPVVSFSTLEEHQPGSAGLALRGIDVKIAPDGEILTRGPHVMLGYWKEPQATAETIREGWLHTGDLGRLDERGHLFITGRKKEIIVTATGKNIFPGHIEELLCRDPLILQAVVVGDRRDCLAALIVPDPDVLRAEIKRRRLWVFSRRGAVRHKKVLAMYRERIDAQLSELARHEQVRRFVVLDRGFTIEDGYMTAKLSLRRSAIEADFSREIEALYRQSSQS